VEIVKQEGDSLFDVKLNPYQDTDSKPVKDIMGKTATYRSD
jgi:hypothetical protein